MPDNADSSRRGGLASWSVRHPVGVTALASAVIVLGLFAVGSLAIDLLPHLIFPQIRVRVAQNGVPATVMEDRVTRQLEEQLAITEDAISVQSSTVQGASVVDLSFEYGKDIDIALRDASTRLDRAKRFLPTTITPPAIWKRDPSQRAILELVVGSSLRDPVELRSWADNVFQKWFLNLPGVAAVEVGGGLVREIHVLPDQQRLDGVGLRTTDLVDALQRGNQEQPAGRLLMSRQEISGRVVGRLTSVDQIGGLPLMLPDGSVLALGEVARVIDTHEDERIRVRVDGIPGIKIAIQKQPTANTVAVVDVVRERLDWLADQGLVPQDVEVHPVTDHSTYVRQALSNASMAAVSGALLAMAVVYLFLGNLRRTLIIGSAIPIALMVTFVMMAAAGLTLNIMTLGGLALGVGMLVDNTIVVMENILRHQREGEESLDAADHGASEVSSAIVASTTTNLAAVLPFLFIGGLVGLLYRELIFTISAAIAASTLIALTLVPALAARVRAVQPSSLRLLVDRGTAAAQSGYSSAIRRVLSSIPLMGMLALAFTGALAVSATSMFGDSKQVFLPKMDDGQVSVKVEADPGIVLEEMDAAVRSVEALLSEQPEVEQVFSIVGGSIMGRTQRESGNKARLEVQLVPLAERSVSRENWAKNMDGVLRELGLAGVRVRLSTPGIRGIQTGSGDGNLILRVRGASLDVLEEITEEVVARISDLPGIRDIGHSAEERSQEIAFSIDRERAAVLGIEVADVSEALVYALEGRVVTDFVDGDRAYDVRVRLPQWDVSSPQELNSVLLYPASSTRPAVHLGDVVSINVVDSPANILRDSQQRIVEITASLDQEQTTLGVVSHQVEERLADLELPRGYDVYEGDAQDTLEERQRGTNTLIALALFLVFVVMAVQYESLVNPLVILLSIPFACVGVAIGLKLTGLPISTPVWLGMVMLAGIVVNNAIVLVECVEIVREEGRGVREAIIEAGRLRLRPILMTTLTTVVGMLPLALGIGDGAEMLQPLAVSIVFGLAFSMVVSLVLVPIVYQLVHAPRGSA